MAPTGAASLDGKVAIVTGAARGIGRAYAGGLAGEGAAVLIADLLEDEGRETAKEIEAADGRAVFQRVDVTDPASVEAMAATAVSEFGGIDILVNNAAMFADLRGGMVGGIDADRWDRTMAVNVKGPWLCTGAVVPHMRARGGGSIINQSSIAAFGLGGMHDYAASKAAIIGLTKNVAIELGRDNIRVNAIAPGGVHTEAHAMIAGIDVDTDSERMEESAKRTQLLGTAIQPADLVGVVLLLAGPAGRMITGQTLCVDGGRFFLG